MTIKFVYINCLFSFKKTLVQWIAIIPHPGYFKLLVISNLRQGPEHLLWWNIHLLQISQPLDI